MSYKDVQEGDLIVRLEGVVTPFILPSVSNDRWEEESPISPNSENQGVWIDPNRIKQPDLPPKESDNWEKEMPVAPNRDDYKEDPEFVLFESSDFAFWEEPETRKKKPEVKKPLETKGKTDYVITDKYFICRSDMGTQREWDKYYKEKIGEHKAYFREKSYKGKECKVFFSYFIPVMNTTMDVSIWEEGSNLYYISTVADVGLKIDTKYFGTVMGNGIDGGFLTASMKDPRPSLADVLYIGRKSGEDHTKYTFPSVMYTWLKNFPKKGLDGTTERSLRRNYKFAYGYGIREDQLKLMPFPLVVFYFGYLKFVDQTMPEKKKRNLFFRALNSK